MLLRKKDKRKSLRARRDELSHAQIEESSLLICDRLKSRVEIQSASKIMAFWPIEGKKEVDLRPFIQWAVSEGKSLFLPAILDAKNGAMTLRPFSSIKNLSSGAFNTLEPISSNVPSHIIDLVLVPGLTFDHRGYRIGYGGGFYDRFLSNTQYEMQSIGVCIDQFIENTINAEQHDVPVKLVLSEVRTIDPANTVTAR